MRSISIFGVALGVVICIEATGCHSKPTEIACALEGYRALLVTVVDSQTAVRVPNTVVRATISGGNFQDSVTVGANVDAYPVVIAHNAATYILTVTSTGFKTWTNTVTVTATEQMGCLVPNSVSITALLQRTP